MVFFESFARLGLMLHLIASAVLLGSLTHALLIQRNYLRGIFARRKHERLSIRVACWAYGITLGLGAMIYPAFRIRVRADYFDPLLPWATGLFEAKEHWGAIGLGLALALHYLRHRVEPAEMGRAVIPYVILTAVWTLVAWYLAFSGAYLTMLRSV